MEAFRAAVERWDVDMLEMDVQVTRDGRIVVLHDETVDRTTDGTGRADGMAWEQMRELDAGCRFVDPDGLPTFRGKGVCVPLFGEVLEAFPRTRINVEAKTPASAPGLVEAIRRHGAEDRVLVAVTEEATRRGIRDWTGPRGASKQQLLRFWFLRRLPGGGFYTPRADALQVPETWRGRRIVTPSFVRAAHGRNLPVHVWTVDEEADMRRLLEWGVDGIQTDRPDRLARVLAKGWGRPLPPALRKRAGGEGEGR